MIQKIICNIVILWFLVVWATGITLVYGTSHNRSEAQRVGHSNILMLIGVLPIVIAYDKLITPIIYYATGETKEGKNYPRRESLMTTDELKKMLKESEKQSFAKTIKILNDLPVDSQNEIISNMDRSMLENIVKWLLFSTELFQDQISEWIGETKE